MWNRLSSRLLTFPIACLRGNSATLTADTTTKMARVLSRGALIVLEGCDRSGKTTQCKKLVEVLNSEGIKSKFMRFPDRSSAIGQVIHAYLEQSKQLEDHAIHLLFTANRWEAVPQMQKELNEGTTLVIDRYAYSGVAYTAAKEGMDLNWCKQPEIGLPKPDLVLYFELDAGQAAARAQYGGERYEKKEFQARVAENYLRLREQDWKVVDASGSIDDVHAKVKPLVKEAIDQAKDTPLQRLWTD